jgi:16S rRNA (guanine966-N2)-methyltransferase
LYIVAGQLKGRKLEMPQDREIRPTPGKVKEAIFSIVGHDLEGVVAIDLFSGTGNLGLEAVSRGASKVYFGEKSKAGYQLIASNISNFGVDKSCKLIRGSWQDVLMKIPESADLIFLDPPYRAGVFEACLEMICSRDLLSDDGIIVAEHDVRESLPKSVGKFSIWKIKKYGNTTITLYTKILKELADEKSIVCGDV